MPGNVQYYKLAKLLLSSWCFRTLEQLPKPHVNLLCHVVCLLYHIDQQRDKNQMNSHNLAVCIGQSLLYPPPNSGTPLQSGSMKVGTGLHGEQSHQEIFSGERLGALPSSTMTTVYKLTPSTREESKLWR